MLVCNRINQKAAKATPATSATETTPVTIFNQSGRPLGAFMWRGVPSASSPWRAPTGGDSGAGALRAGVTTSHYLVYLSSNSWIPPAIIVAVSGKFLIAPEATPDPVVPIRTRV